MTDEKPVAIILPSWNPEEPRFIVKDCAECNKDRQFMNGKVVYNQRLGFAYSVDEIVEALNSLGDRTEEQDKVIMKLLPIISICNKYKIPLEDLPATLEEYIELDQ